MPVEKIVINASPLILLFNSDLEYILPKMFQNIIVPDAVWQEILNSPYFDKAAQRIPDTDWLKKVPGQTVEEVVRWDLGNGETEVLSFVFIQREDTPVIDDIAAKKCAVSLGIPTLGTGSTLILAKEKGIIDSVEKSLMKLRNAGMWISDSMIQLLKDKAGE
jgi:predicted nucleic acid-binding protein